MTKINQNTTEGVGKSQHHGSTNIYEIFMKNYMLGGVKMVEEEGHPKLI